MADQDSAPLDGGMVGEESVLAMNELIRTTGDLKVLRALWTMACIGINPDPMAAQRTCAVFAGSLATRMELQFGFDVHSEIPREEGA